MYVSMKGMLAKANKEGYAVMAINAFNLESAAGVIHAATKMNSPIIIDLLQDHVKAYFDCDVLTKPIIKMAEQTHVPVAINLDHGSDVAHLKRCLHEGFSSVMIDASAHPFDENVAITRSVVEFAQEFDASVEAEVGNMGPVGEGAGFTESDMYTNPDAAIDFINKTGVDALAVSFGSTHGDYPEGYVPTFHFDIVEKIKAATGKPLVLHGGSGNPDSEVAEAVRIGIQKVNISSDYKSAFFTKAREILAQPNSGWDPNNLFPECIEAGKQVIKHKMELFDSKGKAALYRESGVKQWRQDQE
ncbi:class II fructose-bisphosphate aldolase [Olsenella porci]|uniref:Class II fructose-bisphosphate aldolase n=1 Tax=Olsenella porci TaxID=2652279 RepID=A0A6N7XP81_9ACTN|nr:class II fructose-bisphosphate aldolase [Olsenella porci]MST72794.1 class II fructose-bisphosphate aldolase [Olsenella porci]